MEWIVGILVLIVLFLLLRQAPLHGYSYPENGCDSGMPFYQRGSCLGPRIDLAHI